MKFDAQKELATKAFYAAVGAPVVYTRKMKEYAGRFVEYGDKLQDQAQETFDEWAKEGEKVTKQFQDRKVVEEIRSQVDLEKVQDRVEKLRDQLEHALTSWRENFTPHEAPAAAKPAAKAPAKKAPAKTAAAKRAPAKKAPATKAAATKSTTTRKAPAKKAPATKAATTKSTTTRKAPAKAAAK